MSSKITKLSIKQLLSERLEILAQITELAQKASLQLETIKAKLQIAVPSELKQFMEDTCSLDDLFKYGKAGRKIVHAQGQDGFKNAAQVKAAFAELRKAWKGAAKIKINDREAHRVEVEISLIS